MHTGYIEMSFNSYYILPMCVCVYGWVYICSKIYTYMYMKMLFMVNRHPEKKHGFILWNSLLIMVLKLN